MGLLLAGVSSASLESPSAAVPREREPGVRRVFAGQLENQGGQDLGRDSHWGLRAARLTQLNKKHKHLPLFCFVGK